MNISKENVVDRDATKSGGKLPQTGVSNTTIKASIVLIIAIGIGTFVLSKKNKDLK